MAEKKGKQYVSDNAQLMAEWDWEKNNDLRFDPHTLTQGCHTRVWWKCPQGHSYESQIRNRVVGIGCPYCAGKKVLIGYNDLETFYPEVASDWNYERNGTLTPTTVTYASNKKVWWKCNACNGEYEATVANRTKRGSACPYCASQKVLVGYNDLQSQSPELAAEWSPQNILQPTEVTLHSKKKVYWICPLGHDDYLMTIQQRSNRQGCPICAQQSQTSFPEQAIYYYIKQIFPDVINRYIFDNREIDIFIPSQNIGIEYNGYFSHMRKSERDAVKKEFFRSLGIMLLVVKEYKTGSEKNDADFYIHERTSYKNLTSLVKEIIAALGCSSQVDVDCERDAISIKNQYVTLRKENSIAAIRPDLIDRWDYDRNGNITPEMVTLGTGQRFYWKCRICNRSYLAWPSRIAEGSVCAKHHISLKKGINDLATKHPELLKYWDYEKNDIAPSEIFGGGERVVYWKCENGHSFTKSIIKRVRGEGCPICAGKKVLAGYNDLLSQKPELAKEWDYELNDCTPDQIHHNSQSKKVHWICSVCGHRWQYKVSNRNSCPECERKKKLINVYDANDLSFLGTFDSIKALCSHFGLDYKKQHGNISSVCTRKQKTLMSKYILRHAYDDEFAYKKKQKEVHNGKT